MALKVSCTGRLNGMAWLDHFLLAIQALSALLILFLAVVLVWVARQFMAAAEAMQAPCVTVRVKPHDPEDAIPGPATASQPTHAGTVILANVGVGPALDLHFNFQLGDLSERGDGKSNTKFCPFLRAGGSLETTVEKELLQSKDFRFNATYESLSRKRYLTVISIKDRVVRSWNHRKVKSSRVARRQAAGAES